jgi:phosphoglycerol transferase
VLAHASRRGWPYAATTVIVVLFWCVLYERWPGKASFGIPVDYLGDAMALLGIFKGFSELPAPWNLQVHRLNAPFGADWNDFPHSEKLIFYFCGVLNRWFDAGTASNLAVMAAHLGAAITFLWTTRRWNIRPFIGIPGALVFAFSPYLVGRSLPHLNLAMTWHLPVLLYLAFELETVVGSSKTMRAGMALVVAAGSLQHPYYPMMLLQLILAAAARSAVRRRFRAAGWGLGYVGVGLATLVLDEANVFLRAARAGANSTFGGRGLEDLMRWNLRVPDLFLPIHHPIAVWREFATKHYFDAGNTITENYMAFLGVVGCALFVALLLVSLVRGMRGEFALIPTEAWVILYVLLFSLAGGFDYLLGALGFTWLRCANRYSIVILCCLLFWGAKLVAAWNVADVRRGAVTVGVAVISLWECLGMRPDARTRAQQRGEITALVNGDRAFARDLEHRLPHGSNVFELPVVGFPEWPAVRDMVDYEHFRPYLWSWSLRFSYGTHKGRPREAWQQSIEALAPDRLVTYLEQHGFSAILLNRKAFADRGEAFERALRGLHRDVILEHRNKDLVAFKLTKSGDALPLDFAGLTLTSGWWGWESDPAGRWSWSKGSAILTLVASPKDRRTYELSFSLEGLREQHVEVRSEGKVLAMQHLVSGQIQPVTVQLTPRGTATVVELLTDQPARQSAQGADPRELAFRIINPEAVTLRTGPAAAQPKPASSR